MEEVKLYGMWASPFAKRVEMALKMKGIPYEYIEEDIMNKSEKLLSCNPVYKNKKIPVLVHHEKPVSESLIILECIDETWNCPPLLLPEDPFQRAKVRFWTNFIDQQFEGEQQEKIVKEFSKMLKLLEEGVEKDFFSSGTVDFCGGETPGILDIVFCSVFGIHKGDGSSGVSEFEMDTNPLLFKWLNSLKATAVVRVKPKIKD
ncbi:glutathione S-transferase U10-like [Papaver somniferum]|uniref:glutathione S-transferase U10-like n=1 Tax=Papaver somniferum TaxID=3469 RepID=UPI000E6F5160|nr:glutathione S-transferase U10-like [Papaver somniferum]